MTRIRIWAVEGEYDKEAVRILATNICKYLSIEEIDIQTSGENVYNSTVGKHIRKRSDALKSAVDLYLKEDDKIIFVLDSDNDNALNKRRNEKHSKIHQIEKLISSGDYSQCVFLSIAVQELEAWFLTDCLGVCCYFARRRYKRNCRNAISKNVKLKRLVENKQHGDTELIVEAESGGKGAKEYLEKFSEEILKTLNPKMKYSSIRREKYMESLSPQISSYIEINDETIQRNASFKKFADIFYAYADNSKH